MKFFKIQNKEDAIKNAKLGTIGGLIFLFKMALPAILYFVTDDYSLKDLIVPKNELQQHTKEIVTDEIDVLIEIIFIMLLVSFLTFRVYTGSSLIASIILIVLMLLNQHQDYIDGFFNPVWTVFILVSILLLINSIRGTYKYKRFSK